MATLCLSFFPMDPTHGTSTSSNQPAQHVQQEPFADVALLHAQGCRVLGIEKTRVVFDFRVIRQFYAQFSKQNGGKVE
jgi:hypothetical protein